MLTAANTAASGQDIDFAVTRYNADGSLDTSFGTGGTVITAVNADNEGPTSIALQDDGKIVVAGSYKPDGSTADGVVIRYNTDGTLDTTFDGDGMAFVQYISTANDVFNDLVIQPDGRILLTGYANIGGVEQMTVTRLLSDGSLDPSFDGDGMLAFAIGATDDRANAIALQDDGRIVIVGHSHNGVDHDVAVVRLGFDGSLDTTFDGDGIWTSDLGATDVADAVAIDAAGKIVVAGTSSATGSGDSFVLRLTPAGALDGTFGAGGLTTVAAGSPFEAVNELAIQPDGKIVVAGDAYTARTMTSRSSASPRRRARHDLRRRRFRPHGSEWSDGFRGCASDRSRRKHRGRRSRRLCER